MRSLASKTNVQAPGGNYPYGRIKDNPGNNTGTPVNEHVYGDIHQFIERMMAKAGITANGQPENSADGFQIFLALEKIIALKTKRDNLSMAMSGGGVILGTGLKGRRRVPFACKVIGWEITSDTSCTAVVDVWRKPFAGLPAVNGDSLFSGGAEPTITASISGSADLSGTPIDLAEGDYLYYNVDSNNSAKDITVVFIVDQVFTGL